MSSWLLQNKQLICEIRKETKSTKTKQENINKSALKKGQTRQKPKNQKIKEMLTQILLQPKDGPKKLFGNVFIAHSQLLCTLNTYT